MFNYLYGIFGRERNILSRASLPIAGIRQHRYCSTFRDRQSRWRLEQSVWRARCFQFPGVCVIYVLEESGKENKKRNRLKRDAGVKNCSFDKCDESLCCVRGKMSSDSIQYSEKYNDDKYEYRHVILSAELTKLVPKSHLMTETEWRNLTVQQSPGWVHYMMHGPEPHVLLFRRLRSNPPQAMSRNGPVLVEAQN